MKNLFAILHSTVLQLKISCLTCYKYNIYIVSCRLNLRAKNGEYYIHSTPIHSIFAYRLTSDKNRITLYFLMSNFATTLLSAIFRPLQGLKRFLSVIYRLLLFGLSMDLKTGK